MDLTTNGIATDDSAATSYWARYEHLKFNDVMKNVLIEELISRYQGLQTKHDAYVKERSEDEESLKCYRAREKHLTASVDQLQRIMNREPFVLILIDGDGMIFNDSFLRDGEDGGKRAATALQRAATQWATVNVVECPADVKIVVRIYANLKGLSDICYKTGVVPSATLVPEFSRGFTCGRPLFDFVDVGYGKDRADGKLIEMFKLHLYDYHCRQIIFGGSSDNGYARLLEQYILDEEVIPRVTMLEGAPFEKELAVLPYQKHKFAGLFRESKISNTSVDLLGDARRDPRTLSGASAAFTPRSSTPFYSPGGSIPQLDGLPMRPAHLRSDSITSSANLSDYGAIKTWAGTAKVAASLPFTDLAHATSQPQEPASAVKRNRKGQRLDDPMEYDRDEVLRLKKLKCCNQHYIGQGCCHYLAGKADKCPHRHDLRLSSHSLYNLRVVAKETPCKKGSDCDEDKCIYGHSCPFPMATEGSMRGVGCLNGSTCRFPESMHGMDKVPVKTLRVTGLF